jgi:hypothetical protein
MPFLIGLLVGAISLLAASALAAFMARLSS